MLRYKIDIIRELREVGYNPIRIRREGILAESTMTHLRRGEMIRPESLDTVCRLLGCQPGMLIEYVPDDNKAVANQDKK